MTSVNHNNDHYGTLTLRMHQWNIFLGNKGKSHAWYWNSYHLSRASEVLDLEDPTTNTLLNQDYINI